MKKESIVRYSTEELKNFEINGGDKTDWQSLSLMKDEDIKYDEDSQKITEEMFSKATTPKQNQTEITLSLDSDMIKYSEKVRQTVLEVEKNYQIKFKYVEHLGGELVHCQVNSDG